MTRITERQLVLPALYLLSQSSGGTMSTSELITGLTAMMHPTGQDARILAGRHDTYFSQKVRNLKSHDTLVRAGYAVRHGDGFMITTDGMTYVQAHREAIDYLLGEDFNYEDVKEAIDNISAPGRPSALPLEEMVSEGRVSVRNGQTRERSARLRSLAIDYYTQGGRICCACCGFNFTDFYGPVYGRDCIEIHHIKPIFQYGGESIEQTAREAIRNLIPLCPNCHREIHKNHIGSEDIGVFITEMRKRWGME